MENNSLNAYIKYYLTLKAPGFAVLVTGEWGAGKTYQVLNAIPEDKQCHVSLFGINNSQEIFSTVFSKMYPGKSYARQLLDLAKDVTSEINGLTFGAGAVIGSLLNPLIKETVDKSKVIIFDDLERCPMDNKEKLGVINQYVEHHQCRVIIIAHDSKTQDEFTEAKEKIIGHTIRVIPNIDDAANLFFNEKYKLNNYHQIKPYIINAFKKTKCQSLRVLKYIINDCDRLLNCLEPVHIKNIAAMNSLFTSFCIYNTEHKMGNIEFEDIIYNAQDYIVYANLVCTKEEDIPKLNDSEKRLHDFYKKYSEQEVRNGVIDTKLLAKILHTGHYIPSEIVLSLNSSSYFIQKQKRRPWEIIYNFYNIEYNVVQSAIKEMFGDFKSYKITDTGEMLHSFCLSFLLSEKKEINFSYDELYAYQVNYIDELLNKNLLEPNPIIHDPFADDIYVRSHSYGYWIRESYRDYFKMVIEYLDKNREISKTRQYPKYAQEILTALETDIDRFRFLLLGNGAEQGLYSNINVLKNIPPEDFLIHWLMLPAELWGRVRIILVERYKSAAFSELKDEKLWLNELCVTIRIEAQQYEGLQRSRIEHLVPYNAMINL